MAHHALLTLRLQRATTLRRCCRGATARSIQRLRRRYASWRDCRGATARSVLDAVGGAFEGRDRFEAFVHAWAAADDDEAIYEDAASGQTLRARGDYPGLEAVATRSARPTWASALEAAAPAIAREYRAAAAGAHEPFFGGDYGDGYDGLGVADCGAPAPGAEDRFPRTLAALRAVHAAEGEDPPRLGGTRLAFFARHGPRSEVPPHSDLCNFLVTGHLGLDVPEAGCALFFLVPGEAPVKWRANALAPLLQTSFRHAAVNEADAPRVILYFDLFHPDLHAGERAALVAFERARRAAEAAFFTTGGA